MRGVAMGARRRSEQMGAFDQLVQAASAEVLKTLVRNMAATRPELRRQCIDFLKSNVPLNSRGRAGAEAEAAFALWAELEPDLSDLDAYGGGDEGTEERVMSLLSELAQRLGTGGLPREDRRALLAEVLPYIRSGNSGMDDYLYEVADAACHDDEDWRHLAQYLEATGKDWPVGHARGIYRQIGDRDKYLALRAQKLVYGADYHDLATFFWEAGEWDKALEVAREGMKKATGRMDELRAFLAERALETGDRPGYLDLQFAQATDRLSAESYAAFKQLCGAGEWAVYEPRILAVLAQSPAGVRLHIHMLREEYDRAVAALTELRYPRWHDDSTVRIAAQMEERFPEQVLVFYNSGLGRLDVAGSRSQYADNARAVFKLRHMWVDVMKTPEKWLAFARRIKALNRGRRAFQEEFARLIPNWRDL